MKKQKVIELLKKEAITGHEIEVLKKTYEFHHEKDGDTFSWNSDQYAFYCTPYFLDENEVITVTVYKRNHNDDIYHRTVSFILSENDHVWEKYEKTCIEIIKYFFKDK